MFLHGGWAHFLGNMLFLWIFGDNVEDRLGHVRYLIFYLLAGYAATFAHLLFNPARRCRRSAPAGPSRACSAPTSSSIRGPASQTLIFFGFFARFILVPAWVFLPFWFLIQLFSGVASLGVPNAAAGRRGRLLRPHRRLRGRAAPALPAGGARRPRRRLESPFEAAPRRLLLLALLLGAADAFWIEPRLLLFREDVRIDLPAPKIRIAHLSDLHIRGDQPHLHRLLREVAAARPDVVVISGDLIHDVPDAETYAKTSSAVAALIAGLRRVAPVYAVQGHSEHQGNLVGLLQRAGLEWLSNEGRRIGPDGELPAPRA